MKRIGLLTAGGDAPGQNACLKTIVYQAIDQGFEVVGFRKGWEGLLGINLSEPTSQSDHAMLLTKSRVRDIDRMAGSFLHSSRIDPAHVGAASAPHHLKPLAVNNQLLDLTEHIKRVVELLQLEALILLGDNFSLNYAARLDKSGVPIIGIPKTVHNDVCGSDYALGFSTSLANGVRYVHEVRAMAGSREEIAIVEMFGRSFGLTTLLIGMISGADRVLIPESPFDPEKLAALLAEDQRSNVNNYAILAMSEAVSIDPEKAAQYSEDLQKRTGIRPTLPGDEDDAYTIAGERAIGFGAAGGGAVVTEILENLLGQRLLFQPLSYLLRTGEPDGQDLLGAMNFGTLAVNLLAANKTGRLVAYHRGDNYLDLPLEVVTKGEGNIDVAEFYDPEVYRAKSALFWATRI